MRADAPAAPILFVLPALEAGGAERVMLAIAGALARRGEHCHVAAFRGGPLEAIVPEGVALTLIPARTAWRGSGRLRALIQRLGPRCVLSSVTNANLATMWATRWMRNAPRVVLREANLTSKDSASGSLAKRLSTLAGVRLLYGRANRLVALSPEMAEELHAASGVARERIAVIPNPWLRRDAPRGDAGGSDFRLGTSRNLLACGRLDRQKDYPTLLAAFARLAVECDAGLTIVGSGPREAEIRALAGEMGLAGRVEIRNYEPDPTVLMRQADAFVSSSLWEGFPNVVLEAICEGCPVVSTRSSDAVLELVDSEDIGRVVPVGDPEALAQALRAVLGRPRGAAGDPGHRERYHLDKIADLYAEVISSPA